MIAGHESLEMSARRVFVALAVDGSILDEHSGRAGTDRRSVSPEGFGDHPAVSAVADAPEDTGTAGSSCARADIEREPMYSAGDR